MTYRKGDRVGAILGTDCKKKTVSLLGYGTYRGDEVPPAEIGGFNAGIANPKIELDNSDVVWGCEVWWGDESAMKRRIYNWETEGYTIETVSIHDARAQALSREKA